jgi:predicted phage terminase large subunit-like protein
MLTADAVYGFSASVLAARYDDPKPIPDCHIEWWELCCSDHPKVAIAAPRSCAKSTAITFAYVLAMIAFKQARHIMVISANEEIASLFVKDIGNEFNENQVLAKAVGFKRLQKESETEIVGLFDDGSKFRVIAKGAGQRMRGIKWERKRPDLVVIDDLEDDESVLNKSRRDKLKRWFYGAVIPILKDGGKIRMVGTIVHQDSLLEGLMPEPKDPNTVDTALCMYSNTRNPSWMSKKYRAHSPDFEDLLWPDQLGKAKLLRIRKDFKERGLLDVYAQEYLNNPIDDSTAYFTDDDFIEVPKGLEGRPKTYYAGIDFAISQNERADYTAAVIISVDPDGQMEVEHCRKGRWDALEIFEQMFQIQKQYDISLWVAESGSIQKSLGPFLFEEMRRRQIFMPIEVVTATKDKESRARSIQARMRAKGVWFDKDKDWYPDFYEELRRFPKGTHDDQVDAFAHIGARLSQMVESSSVEQVEEEEYEEALEVYGDDGRSSVTGY